MKKKAKTKKFENMLKEKTKHLAMNIKFIQRDSDFLIKQLENGEFGFTFLEKVIYLCNCLKLSGVIIDNEKHGTCIMIY